jgi:hypothetical protein
VIRRGNAQAVLTYTFRRTDASSGVRLSWREGVVAALLRHPALRVTVIAPSPRASFAATTWAEPSRGAFCNPTCDAASTVGHRQRGAAAALAVDVKVILTPPCIFH